MERVILVLAVFAVSAFAQDAGITPFRHNISVVQNANVELICKTNNINHKNDLISWTRVEDNQLISFRDEIINKGDDPLEPGISERYTLDTNKENEYTLKITDAIMLDQSKWICQIQGGHPAKEAIWLTVRSPPVITVVFPGPTLFAEKNSTHTLRCKGRGSPDPSIVWSRPGRVLPNGDVLYHGDELELVNMTSEDRGTYQCSASNTLGVARESVVITMNYKPKIFVYRKSVKSELRGKATLTCEFDGFPAPSEILWRKNGVEVFDNLKEQIKIRTTAKQTSVSFGRVKANQYGEYECRIRNSQGVVNERIQFNEGKAEATPDPAQLSAASGVVASLVVMVASLFAAFKL
ncbi:limbic system-associated membrane protein-like [Glandiceps talaboti]